MVVMAKTSEGTIKKKFKKKGIRYYLYIFSLKIYGLEYIVVEDF